MPEGGAHERTPGVVPKPPLVIRAGRAVAAEVAIGQLAEGRSADKTDDDVTSNRATRIGSKPLEFV